jgi:hypothetical protein
VNWRRRIAHHSRLDHGIAGKGKLPFHRRHAQSEVAQLVARSPGPILAFRPARHGEVPRRILGRILWLASAASLMAAAFSLLGFIVPSPWWRVLAGVGARISLVLFIPYAHPLYTVGIAANAAILLLLLWAMLPSPAVLGS